MFRLIVVIFSLFLINFSICAQTEDKSGIDSYTKIRAFSEGQLLQYKATIRQIRVVQSKIQDYYKFLSHNNTKGCMLFHGGEQMYCDFYKIQKNGMTYVPLNARKETIYGQRQRYVYNEIAYFKWNNDKIESFYFETRRGYLGTIRVLNRLFYGNSIADDADQVDPKKPPMGLVINEVLPTGSGTFAQFVFASQNNVFDKSKDSLDINGRKLNLKTLYIRDTKGRLRIIKKYLNLLKRLETRLQWNVHSANYRNESQLESVLQDSLN